ncbi:2-C-methyl-D-erythritol 4-phosphate cytidylyltransferase [Thermophilibacter sp.]
MGAVRGRAAGEKGADDAASPCPCACAERVGAPADGPDTCAIVVAGGSGERFGDPRGKQFVDLVGLPLMCWSVAAFDRAPSVARIVVVCAPERAAEVERDVLGRLSLAKPVTLAPSGPTRQASVRSGLDATPRGLDLVAVHDAARPLVETELVERVIAAVRADETLGGAILATRCTDTLKLVEGTQIVATPDRSFYWAAQTPQVFRRRVLLAAHKAAEHEEYQGTDDASLVERVGGRVRVVESTRDNLKVTVPEDLAIAEATLERRLLM